MNKIVSKFRHVRKTLFADRQTKRFIQHNEKVWQGWNSGTCSSVVLVDFYSVSETLISYSYFVNVLARKHNARIVSFSGRQKIPNRVLHKVYRSFNTAGHMITRLNGEQEERAKTISREIIPGLRTKQDIFGITVSDIWIGNDIYETYLREYNKPTVFLDDPKLFEMVEEAIGLVIFWSDFFAKNKVAAVVVSHDVYISMDIVCKVAYHAKVPVYLPNVRGISLVDKPFSIYTYFPDYRKMFESLPREEQERGKALAKKQLERRLAGEVGVDMPYAEKSAYTPVNGDNAVLKETEKIKVLICTHCFYDNPHAYNTILFLDFYEWLHFLGRISERTDYDWYLKMHPDPRPGTFETIQEILTKFPRITYIPHDTSHQQLVKDGINFVLTVYGTVGHEYPAFGVQVINAGYNPRIAYDFNWHPKTIEEYEHYLMNLHKLKKDIRLDEVYEFYYMHHYYTLADDLVLKSYNKALSDLSPEQRIGSEIYGYFLDQLNDEKHGEIIQNMEKFIQSGKRNYFASGPE